MSSSKDHKQFLRKKSFAIARSIAKGLTSQETEFLRRYGHWLEALANQVIKAQTPAQKHFCRVARGWSSPITDYEKAWLKIRPAKGFSGRGKKSHEPEDFEDLGEYGEYGYNSGDPDFPDPRDRTADGMDPDELDWDSFDFDAE